MEVKDIVRKFKYGKIDLPDPDPNRSAQEVVKFYANQYPELVNSNIKEDSTKVIDGVDTVTFQISVGLGTKG